MFQFKRAYKYSLLCMIFLLLNVDICAGSDTPSANILRNQLVFEESLSLLRPLFDEGNNYDFLYNFSIGSPYAPYFMKLHDGDLMLGFFYDYKTDSKEIVVQIKSNTFFKNFDKEKLKYTKVNDHFVYYTKNFDKLKIERTNYEFPVDIEKLETSPIAKPKNSKRSVVDPRQVVDLLKNHKNLLMTGAGISYKVIPSFIEFKAYASKLTTEDAVLNPELLVSIFKEWFESFFKYETTPAHNAIADICKYTNSSLITGNFDMLHQKSGLIPFRIQGHLFPLYEKAFEADAKNIELLFIIGSGIDIRGQIDAFRRVNPSIKILALLLDSKQSPSYLKSGDYVIYGDAHLVLPEIALLLQ